MDSTVEEAVRAIREATESMVLGNGLVAGDPTSYQLQDTVFKMVKGKTFVDDKGREYIINHINQIKVRYEQHVAMVDLQFKPVLHEVEIAVGYGTS